MSGDLIGLGDLAKPASALVERVFGTADRLAKPKDVVNLARAESEAALIKAYTDIEIRRIQRSFDEEIRQQENREEITAKALYYLEPTAKPQDVAEDFYANLFDKCRSVSDESMQGIWARILAGEANTPGRFSRKTINVLGDMDSSDALLFQRLCRFCWSLGGAEVPLILNVDDEIYTSNSMTFETLGHLDSLGLVRYDYSGGLSLGIGPNFMADYGGCWYEGTSSEDWVNTGTVFYTAFGQQLQSITKSEPVEGFVEYLLENWDVELTARDPSENEPS